MGGVFWDFCQFSLLDDTFRCRYGSTGSYCANNSFKLFCKDKSPDLTLWKVACFPLEWYWFALECYTFLLFFTRTNLASPNRFHFNLNWKRVGKQRVVFSLWQLLTLWWVFNKNFQFAVFKLIFSPRICVDLWKSCFAGKESSVSHFGKKLHYYTEFVFLALSVSFKFT